MAKDTSEYSSTKAPETRDEAEERTSQPDSRLIPGGAEPRTHAPQGIEALDRDTVPGMAQPPGQTRSAGTGKDEVPGE